MRKSGAWRNEEQRNEKQRNARRCDEECAVERVAVDREQLVGRQLERSQVGKRRYEEVRRRDKSGEGVRVVREERCTSNYWEAIGSMIVSERTEKNFKGGIWTATKGRGY